MRALVLSALALAASTAAQADPASDAASIATALTGDKHRYLLEADGQWLQATNPPAAPGHEPEALLIVQFGERTDDPFGAPGVKTVFDVGANGIPDWVYHDGDGRPMPLTESEQEEFRTALAHLSERLHQE